MVIKRCNGGFAWGDFVPEHRTFLSLDKLITFSGRVYFTEIRQPWYRTSPNSLQKHRLSRTRSCHGPWTSSIIDERVIHPCRDTKTWTNRFDAAVHATSRDTSTFGSLFIVIDGVIFHRKDHHLCQPQYQQTPDGRDVGGLRWFELNENDQNGENEGKGSLISATSVALWSQRCILSKRKSLFVTVDYVDRRFQPQYRVGFHLKKILEKGKQWVRYSGQWIQPVPTAGQRRPNA